MLKIYSSNRQAEQELIEFLGEFPKHRVFVNYPIKGRTRKVRGTGLYRIINFPIAKIS